VKSTSIKSGSDVLSRQETSALKEISRLLGVSRDAAHRHEQIALRKLRKLLKERGITTPDEVRP
jgi:DNA-directed RNA polymerase specialized sigma24 family protein